MYAVNWPVEESDLTPISMERLRSMLGIAEVTIEGAAAGDDGASPGFARRLGLHDPADAALVVLLALLVGEMLLSARIRPRAT